MQKNMITLTIYENANHRMVDNFCKLTDYYYKFKAVIYAGLYAWQDFDTQEAFDDFIKATGLQFELMEERPGDNTCSKHWVYEIKDNIYTRYITNLEEIHPNSTPVVLIENGDYVKCYTHREGNNIYIAIPNPNAKDIREVIRRASIARGCSSEFEKRLI